MRVPCDTIKLRHHFQQIPTVINAPSAPFTSTIKKTEILKKAVSDTIY